MSFLQIALKLLKLSGWSTLHLLLWLIFLFDLIYRKHTSKLDKLTIKEKNTYSSWRNLLSPWIGNFSFYKAQETIRKISSLTGRIHENVAKCPLFIDIFQCIYFHSVLSIDQRTWGENENPFQDIHEPFDPLKAPTFPMEGQFRFALSAINS